MEDFDAKNAKNQKVQRVTLSFLDQSFASLPLCVKVFYA